MRSETSLPNISSNEKLVFLLQDVGASARGSNVTTATAVSDA